jgi:hypothetical protein
MSIFDMGLQSTPKPGGKPYIVKLIPTIESIDAGVASDELLYNVWMLLKELA